MWFVSIADLKIYDRCYTSWYAHVPLSTQQKMITDQYATATMTKTPLFEEDKDYIDEDHIHAFAKALVWDHNDEILDKYNSDGAATPLANDTEKDAEVFAAVQGGTNAISLSPMRRPDMITSKSDWYPLTNASRRRGRKIKKSDNKTLRNEFRSSATYTIVRWPFLGIILGWIVLLFVFYITVRVYVALLEYYLTWVGERRKLRNKLRASTTYEEWIENALALDRYLNLDKWSINPKFSYYDSKTVKLTISRLRTLREARNDSELMIFLQGCLKKNFAGIENRQLYSHRYYGTKLLVEEYIEEAVKCIDQITDSKHVDAELKRKFFRIVLKNYGKSALCLSGGATFSYIHFGLVKALIDNDLLPSIVSGTSGGGIVAALTCTRTDEELKKLLVPELARKITACEDPWYVWIPRFWKTGARFDAVSWARKSNFFTRGSMTFDEAFHRSGRKLNISTVPADPHSPVILCNNITSPHCIIWSSLLASSAVPGILNPVVLMMKNPSNNEVIPFSLGNKWRDGSLRTDIPIDALNTYYNVNFQIVSQVNPHISLFFFAPKGAVGRPVALPRRKTHKEKYASLRGGFVATALEQLFKLEITKWLQMIKTLDLLPHFLEQDWLNIWLQRFTGSITIWPRNKLLDFVSILSDPSEAKLGEMILKGERSVFPKLLFIKHRLRIERAIERGRKESQLSNSISRSYQSTPEVPEDFQIHAVEYNDDDDYEDDLSAYEVSKYHSQIAQQLAKRDDDDEDDKDYSPFTSEESSDEAEDLEDLEEDIIDVPTEPKPNFLRSLLKRTFTGDGDDTSKKHRRNTIT